MDIKRHLEIATALGFDDCAHIFETALSHSDDAECPLVLPLVGEFSAGKTTLINAMTDSKVLETGTYPTTSTIYEVHFGSDEARAMVLHSDGTSEGLDTDTDLDNKKLADATVVTLFDTSKRVPSSIVLVDTPGLSSPDIRHRQALMEFLPHADGILLTMDINQQLTKSLVDFVKTASMAKRAIYLILTCADTKSPSEVEASISYLRANQELAVRDIVAVSALKDNLQPFYGLLEKIQQEKSEILQQVDTARCAEAATTMRKRIEEVLAASNDGDKLEQAIAENREKLERYKKEVAHMNEGLKSEIESAKEDSQRLFEQTIGERLMDIMSNSGGDYNAAALSAINNTSALILNDFKSEVKSLLRARSEKLDDQGMELIDEIDLSQYHIGGLGYNLDLNRLGHEYDGIIAMGVKMAVVAAAGAAGAGQGGSVAINAADTASDILFDGGAMMRAARHMTGGNMAVTTTPTTTTGTTGGSELVVVQPQAQPTPAPRLRRGQGGLVESLVGLVTDNALAKPQRRRAIFEYMEAVLLPSYRDEMDLIAEELTSQVEQTLMAMASENVENMQQRLEQMKDEHDAQSAAFEERVAQLQQYLTEIEQ